MALNLPPLRVLPPAHDSSTSRRSFLRYTGASAALGSLWLAGCKKEETSPAAAPTIASFTPASGMPGATITITGTNLVGVTSLLLGTVAATFTVVNSTTVTFTVPATAQTGTITLTTGGGAATSGSTFTVLPAAATAPAITSFSPTSAYQGATVTVEGSNFLGATGVTVNGTATTFAITNATTLTFVVPVPPGPVMTMVAAPVAVATGTMKVSVVALVMAKV
ncbi:MAG: hypothetical protein EOO59_18610, partial [Hymenobacter sp.]